MNRQTLADVLQSTSQTGSYTLATVLEGVEAGSQLLLRDGDDLWQTQSTGLLQRQLSALQACTATGFLTLDGQRVFAERFGAVPQLVVCGGGHVAAALVKQAKLLGMPVLAIDDREEFAQQLRAAGADTVLCAPFAQALQDVPGGAETYFCNKGLLCITVSDILERRRFSGYNCRCFFGRTSCYCYKLEL